MKVALEEAQIEFAPSSWVRVDSSQDGDERSPSE